MVRSVLDLVDIFLCTLMSPYEVISTIDTFLSSKHCPVVPCHSIDQVVRRTWTVGVCVHDLIGARERFMDLLADLPDTRDSS